MLPPQTMAMAITTFVGQNLGANKVKRARRGVRVFHGHRALIATLALAAIALAFGRDFLRMFTSDPDVVEAGYSFLTVFAPTYFLLCFTQNPARRAARRGRCANVHSHLHRLLRSNSANLSVFDYKNQPLDRSTVALGFPLTWALAAAALTIYYLKTDWSRHSLVSSRQAEQPECAG